jgi:hypothetical protein
MKSIPVEKIKGPDYSSFRTLSLLTAEVVKSDDTKVTMRVYWQVAVPGRNNRRSLNGGGRHHSPFMMRRPNVQVKWEHKDYIVPFVEESLVRTKSLPPKLDSNGKRGYYSAKEQDEMKVPFSAPGYQATKADLVPGTIVEAHLMHDKLIPPSKVTDADVKVQYLVILRHDPNPPKDIAAPPKAPSSPAKKN